MKGNSANPSNAKPNNTKPNNAKPGISKPTLPHSPKTSATQKTITPRSK